MGNFDLVFLVLLFCYFAVVLRIAFVTKLVLGIPFELVGKEPNIKMLI